jgi:hypothetical protein
MACWVVPSIAAEFWRVPLDHVMDQIRRNAVPVRRENGFTFVDILPDPQTGEALPPERRPPTFVEAGPRDEVSGVRVEVNPEWVSQNPARLQAATSRRPPVRAA